MQFLSKFQGIWGIFAPVSGPNVSKLVFGRKSGSLEKCYDMFILGSGTNHDKMQLL